LAISGVLVTLSLPIFPHDLQAYGNNFVATALMAGMLGWYLRHPANDANVPTAAALSASGRVP
jgi:hypothetical protein